MIHKRRSRTLLASLIATALLAVAPAALAQPAAKPAARPAAPVDDGRGYEYKFTYDLLAGGGMDGTAPIIRVRAHALRSQLIRPRTSFVPEMLKSAESF
jgi:hypothetical protein